MKRSQNWSWTGTAQGFKSYPQLFFNQIAGRGAWSSGTSVSRAGDVGLGRSKPSCRHHVGGKQCGGVSQRRMLREDALIVSGDILNIAAGVTGKDRADTRRRKSELDTGKGYRQF